MAAILNSKIKKFESDLKALEILGLEIVEEKSNSTEGGQSELSRKIFKGDRNSLSRAKSKIARGQELKRSKIGLLAEIVRRIKNLGSTKSRAG
jgi:hypothetical protein